ncbi:hypothetical protein DJ564_28935 [Pseudomonas sp. 31-12]|uniref:hypothetical protein n=1 Tax=Pseudomonas sp. 31-12 TaxID=2201356 RepID=UPI000D6BC7D5|nr:hypothetical protein [Pseudomonas sp. 31-12]AWM94520.1 hypothetical protein DJ564_28935 [Pseudomonas sp. 31-12]
MKNLIVTTALIFCLTGCVGVLVAVPEKTTLKTDAYRDLTYQSSTPVITSTVKSSPTREWCGITLWAVIIPVPLKLPVCESYYEQSFGNDVFGNTVVLLNSEQKVPEPFYTCGPFMVLGPISHGYEGNALCGTFP